MVARGPRLQLDTLDLAHQQDVGKCTDQRQDRDIGDGRGKGVTAGKEADDDRRGDGRQVADEVEYPAGQPKQSRRARVDTSDQVIEARPLPKNASARKAITSGVDSTKLAPMIEVEISRPLMIGNLRAKPTE